MNTLEISAEREMSPNVRDISSYRRMRGVQVIEVPRRRKASVLARVKFFGIIVFASFLLVTSVNEGVRTWLKYSGGNAEASGDFMVPRTSALITRVNQPVIYQARPVDQAGMLREENRYRVDMARERNRFVTSLLGHAERLTGRLSR